MVRFARAQERALTLDRVVACPYCASVLCKRLERNGYDDFLRRLFGFYPWYCKTCGGRFYAWKRNYKPAGHVASQTARKLKQHDLFALWASPC